MTSVYKTLSKERTRTRQGTFAQGITLAKIKRDVEIFSNKASYVIELDIDGNVLEAYSNPPFEKLLDCIVVISPIVFEGAYIDQAIVLEIGISRFVPYKRTEVKANKPDKKKQCKVIHARSLVETLSWEKTQKILPALWRAIQFCVDSKMETWTRGTFIQKPRSIRIGATYFPAYEAWIMIRIPKEHVLLYAILKSKDEIDRSSPNKNYHSSSELISEEFNFFMKLYGYEKKEHSEDTIKKSEILEKVAKRIERKIKQGSYTKRSIEAIKNMLRTKQRGETFVSLFDSLFHIFDIPEPTNDVFLDEYEPLLKEKGIQNLVDTCTLRPMVIHRCDAVRKSHASNCLSIAIIGSREHLERLDIRNTNNRLFGSNQKKTGDTIELDNDIPF
jgi:hypothetical protein